MLHINKIKNTTTGKRTNNVIAKNSKTTRIKKRIRSATMTKLFIKIPIPMEKPTNPSLYSFFQGLKYVFISRGIESSLRKLRFKDLKKESKDNGASKNQNFKNKNGSNK